MKLSVIVSTYNSPQWLEKVLVGYACQSENGFELVVADDGSGDETRKLVERVAKSAPYPLRHVWHEDNGFRKCAILNKALLAATGDYVVFTDGDCIPRADFLAVHRLHAEPGRFLSGGCCRLPMRTSEAISTDDIRSGHAFLIAWLAARGFRPSINGLKITARPWRIDALLNAVTPARSTFNGNNSSCFREDALRVGGFDERMSYGGEDREFGYRLENAGIRPKVIRHSALCLHLEHSRGYMTEAGRNGNEAIIAVTRARRVNRTQFGI